MVSLKLDVKISNKTLYDFDLFTFFAQNTGLYLVWTLVGAHQFFTETGLWLLKDLFKRKKY